MKVLKIFVFAAFLKATILPLIFCNEDDDFVAIGLGTAGGTVIGAESSFNSLEKDDEVFPSVYYIIETRNTSEVDMEVSESYLYAKSAVEDGSNLLAFATPNLGDIYTCFKIPAIQDNNKITYLTPQSNTEQEASEAPEDYWKFKYGDGDNSEGYAAFVCDLSQFNEVDVFIAISVHSGEIPIKTSWSSITLI